MSSQSTLENVQNLLRNIQKTMNAKLTTVRAQWNAITCLEKLSQVQFCRRMNVFGVSCDNKDMAQLFYYIGIKKNSMDFNDFMTLMETDPESLGPKTRRLPQVKGFEHETMKSFEQDFNAYCRRTAAYTPSTQTRSSYLANQAQKKTKKITRPFTTSTSKYGSQYGNSKKQRASSNRSNVHDYEEDQYVPQDNQYAAYDDNQYANEDYGQNHEHNHTCSLGDSGTFGYESCKACFERSTPLDKSNKKTREATLRSFTNTSIQRHDYDGIDVSKKLNRDSGLSVKELVNSISDIAYTSYPNSWTCFLRWRDPHHDLLDANDLRKALRQDNKLNISQADAQKVIESYGGPMNHSTFAVMLHDGSQFNRGRYIGEDDY